MFIYQQILQQRARFEMQLNRILIVRLWSVDYQAFHFVSARPFRGVSKINYLVMSMFVSFRIETLEERRN